MSSIKDYQEIQKRKRKAQTISFSLNQELDNEFRLFCKLNNLQISLVLQELIKEFLKKG